MADATSGIGDVAGVAWDYVEMQLGDGLAGGWAIVKAEIKSVGLSFENGLQMLHPPIHPVEQSKLFFLRKLVKAGNEAFDDDEGMTWGNGIFVASDEEQLVLSKYALRFNGAESLHG